MLINIVPVNYLPCYQSKEHVLVVCMAGLPSEIQAWSLAHRKAATEREVENFWTRAVLWSCPAASGLRWCWACCSYLAASFFFLNSKYFFLLSMWLSLPEVEHFDYEVWQRENVYHMYFTTKIMVPLFELIQPHSPQDSSLRESGLPSKSCLAPLPVTSFSSMAFIQSKTANRLFFFLIYCMAI